METVSWAVIGIIAVSMILLLHRRLSPTMILAAANIAVFATVGIGEYLEPSPFYHAWYELGYKSWYFFHGEDPWTIVTSMFMHANFMHLMFNMLYLLLIGFPLESRMGRWRFICVYLLGGIAGTLVFSAVEGLTIVPLVGASGAISALLGAMIMLYPRERIMFFVGPILTNRFSVWVPILVWFAMQIFLFSFEESGVAYAAHLGGFAAGAGIAWAIRPRHVKKEEHQRLDVTPLKRLCVTHALLEMYNYAYEAKDDETRMMWIEKILTEVWCTACGAKIEMKRGRFECRNGHMLQ